MSDKVNESTTSESFSSSFLSADEIIDAVTRKDICIAYYAIQAKDGTITQIPNKRFVTLNPKEDTDDLDQRLRDYFLSSLEPDSLRLHVGPYAMVEVFRGREGKQFAERRGEKPILNVERASNLLIYPQEFTLIGTNEYIEVSDRIGGSLYSNVRNTDIGLSHISTIIDPSWKGILQIGVTNPTRYTKQLKYLDSLCIVRFHRLRMTAPEHVIHKFQLARPHFGNDWWLLKQEPGREIFPRRKEYSYHGVFLKRIRGEILREKIVKYGLTAALLGAAVAGIRLYDRIGKVDKSYDAIQRIDSELVSLKEVGKRFHVLDTGAKSLRFSEDNRQVVFDVVLAEPCESPPSVLLTFEGLEFSTIKYETQFTNEGSGSRNLYRICQVKITYAGQLLQNETLTGKVVWLLVFLRK